MKKIVVLGAGESGIGAAILAKKQGLDVFVSDKSNINKNFVQELTEYGIPYEQGKHSKDIILNADIVIKSPGIPDNSALIVEISKNNIPIISEIEFAAKYTDANFICITGSNGKTTTTLLCYTILKDAGINVGIAGNIGKSLARCVAFDEAKDWYVLELSSFQLDGMYDFRANIAVLLNITPDHLDRYDYKIENYINSKFRIIQNQNSEDYFVYCIDDKVVVDNIRSRDVNAEIIGFSGRKVENSNAYCNNDNIIVNVNNEEISIPVSILQIKGIHNKYNVMVAAIIGKLLNVNNKSIEKSLSNFKGVEHRLEDVLTINGVSYINDSKATNVNSTWYALDAIDNNIIWIAGGVDKGNDYSELYNLVQQKVKALICLGIDNDKLNKAFDNIVPVIKNTNSISQAVQMAFELATKGDVVLLSPACASFDLFKNYEQRGLLFKEEIYKLKV